MPSSSPNKIQRFFRRLLQTGTTLAVIATCVTVVPSVASASSKSKNDSKSSSSKSAGGSSKSSSQTAKSKSSSSQSSSSKSSNSRDRDDDRDNRGGGASGSSGYYGSRDNDDRNDRYDRDDRDDRDPRGREGNHSHIYHGWNGVGNGHPNHNGNGYGHENCDHDGSTGGNHSHIHHHWNGVGWGHEHHQGNGYGHYNCFPGGGGGGGGGGGEEPPVLIPVTIVNTSGVLLVVPYGGTIAFTAELLTGSAPVTYQWMKRNSQGAYSAIPGATSLTLDLTDASESDNGTYWIVATNELGSVSSTETLVVVATDLAVLNTTGDQVFFEPGDTLSLTAELVSGTEPVSYQWMMRFGANPPVAIPGATSLNHTIENATEDDAGQYWLVATNSNGTVTTSQTQVIVAGIPHE